MGDQGGRFDPRDHDAPGAAEEAVAELAAVCDREDVAVDAERVQLDHETGGEWGDDETGLFVGSVVHDGEGRALLVENQWSEGLMGPGGTVEPGEGLREALRREVREETGVRVRVERPLCVDRQRFYHGSDPDTWVDGYFVTFRAVATDPELAADPGVEGERIHRVEWVDVQSIPEDTRGYERIVSAVPRP